METRRKINTLKSTIKNQLRLMIREGKINIKEENIARIFKRLIKNLKRSIGGSRSQTQTFVKGILDKGGIDALVSWYEENITPFAEYNPELVSPEEFKAQVLAKAEEHKGKGGEKELREFRTQVLLLESPLALLLGAVGVILGTWALIVAYGQDECGCADDPCCGGSSGNGGGGDMVRPDDGDKLPDEKIGMNERRRGKTTIITR